MDYVALLSFKTNLSASERDAALIRRAGWQFPEGLRVIAEYWPMASDTAVVTIFSADHPDVIFELVLEWSDVFDINVYPALSAEDGLRIGAEAMGRVTRLQQ
jgi:hypothetical protein